MGMKSEARLRALMEQIDQLNSVSAVLAWDMRIHMPAGGAAYRSEQMRRLAQETHALRTSPQMEEVLTALEADPPRDSVALAMAQKARREFDRVKRVPEDLFAAYAAHNLKTEHLWPLARAANDYERIRPLLAQEFAFKRELAACYGFESDPLTGLMDQWEQGLSRTRIEYLFEALKRELIPLSAALRDGPQPKRNTCRGVFPKEKQKAFCHELLQTVGFDFDRGRVDESPHPYTTVLHAQDVRITCRYFEDDFTRAIFSTLHEGGHAIYGQSVDPALMGTGLGRAASFPMDEGQARFLECMIGHSLPFWEWALPLARRYFPALEAPSPSAFWRELNALTVTPLRLGSDELSYNLHILLRFELEKALFDGTLSFRDLPGAWNEKSEEYLGVRPQKDGEGVLQDMHWFSGFIGYFQNYTLGNCYASQLLQAMERDVPDLDDRIRRGDFAAVKEWNGAHVHRFGAVKSAEQILRDATGSGLDVSVFIRYLKEKYARVYGLAE
jgi:carboxypeptidase Taq